MESVSVGIQTCAGALKHNKLAVVYCSKKLIILRSSYYLSSQKRNIGLNRMKLPMCFLNLQTIPRQGRGFVLKLSIIYICFDMKVGGIFSIVILTLLSEAAAAPIFWQFRTRQTK